MHNYVSSVMPYSCMASSTDLVIDLPSWSIRESEDLASPDYRTSQNSRNKHSNIALFHSLLGPNSPSALRSARKSGVFRKPPAVSIIFH